MREQSWRTFSASCYPIDDHAVTVYRRRSGLNGRSARLSRQGADHGQGASLACGNACGVEGGSWVGFARDPAGFRSLQLSLCEGGESRILSLPISGFSETFSRLEFLCLSDALLV